MIFFTDMFSRIIKMSDLMTGELEKILIRRKTNENRNQCVC